MGLKQEFVFRCDVCNSQMGGEEYAYPWQHTEQGEVNFLCRGCNFVTGRLSEKGILNGWRPMEGQQPVHVAIYHKQVNKEYQDGLDKLIVDRGFPIWKKHKPPVKPLYEEE